MYILDYITLCNNKQENDEILRGSWGETWELEKGEGKLKMMEIQYSCMKFSRYRKVHYN